jgi:outer membrane protein assembly factor BamD
MKAKNGSQLIIVVGLIGVWLLAGCGGVTMKNYATAELQYRNAKTEFQKKHYLKAIDGFQKVIYNFGGSSVVDSAQYYLAMSYYEQKDFYMAAAEFERLATTYPGSPFVDDAQYMAGLCYFKSAPKSYGLDQDELQKALEALNDFVTDNPESELADDARATIAQANERLAHKRYANGRMYYRLGYYDAAEIYFQHVIDEHTNTKWAARALFYTGEIKVKQKKFSEARDIINNFLVVYPKHEYHDKAVKLLTKIDEKIAETAEKN